MTTPPKPPTPDTPPTVRTEGLIARAAPVAVLFFRASKNRVLLVYWDMERDLFHPGQWLKGRIRARWSDLSPSGKRLLYLADNQTRPPYFSWTAVSRPPYLTAIAFWPNHGWAGGGYFETEDRVCLSHNVAGDGYGEGVRVPPELSVRGVDFEDDTLPEDGWVLVQHGNEVKHRHRTTPWTEYDPPYIWSRPQPRGAQCWELRMIGRGVTERQGPEVFEYALSNPATGQDTSLGRLDWADWCHSGDLVFTKGGCVWRLALNETTCPSPLEEARLLVDLSPLTFRELAPPPEARDLSADVLLPPPYPG